MRIIHRSKLAVDGDLRRQDAVERNPGIGAGHVPGAPRRRVIGELVFRRFVLWLRTLPNEIVRAFQERPPHETSAQPVSP